MKIADRSALLYGEPGFAGTPVSKDTCHKFDELSVRLTKYYSGDQIKKNEMDRACDTYGRQERCVQGFGAKTEGTWKT
jgi:hypothetical protein